MAIIYTYPPLTSPVGNELIVVTDVNNKNATRNITVADIASLVPAGGGCSTAITGIVDEGENPLYQALLCNDVKFVSTDGSIFFQPTAGNDGVDFSVAYAPLTCATPTELGGVKISSQYATEQIPTPVTQNFAAYPVETTTAGASQDECTAIVRIPNIQVDCATSVTNGTIKVASGLADNPTIAESGEYYAVQVDSNCLASVRIPTSEEGCNDVWKTITSGDGQFSFDASGCSSTLTLNSPSGTIGITSFAQGQINFDLISVPCATGVETGGIKVSGIGEAAINISEGSTAYGVEVNENCEAYVRVPASGGGGGEQAWSPLSIYEASSLYTAGDEIGLMVQSVAEATITGMNKVDYFLGGVSQAGDVLRFDIYQGTLESGGTWLGGGVSSGTAGTDGVDTITIPGGVNIIAGDKYVLYFRIASSNGYRVAINSNGAQHPFLALSNSLNGGTGVPNIDLATQITEASLIDEGPLSSVRIAHTMYKA